MSEIRANTIADAAGTGPATFTKQYAAKTVLLYDQTTPSVGRGENVSSVTDNSAGVFTVNYTNNFDAADYVLNAQTGIDTSGGGRGGIAIGVEDNATAGVNPSTTSSIQCVSSLLSSAAAPAAMADVEYDMISIFGDLA